MACSILVLPLEGLSKGRTLDSKCPGCACGNCLHTSEVTDMGNVALTGLC
jgi:hypothetical protein